MVLKQTFNYRHVLTEFPLRYHLQRLFLIYFRKSAVNDQSSIKASGGCPRKLKCRDNVVIISKCFSTCLNFKSTDPHHDQRRCLFRFVFIFTIIQQHKTEKIKELTTLTLVINIKIAQHLAVLFTVHYTIFKLFLPLQPSTDPR